MGQIVLQVNKTINERNIVDLQGYYIFNNDKVIYSGSTISTERFHQLAYGAMAGYTFQADKFYGRFEGGLIGERNEINDTIMSDVVPLFNLDTQYAFDQKHSLNLTASYNSNLVDLSDKTSTVIQENELLYKTGNPKLKNTRRGSVDLQYTWLPNNQYQISASGGLSRYFDRPVPLFTHTGPDGMMLRSGINGTKYGEIHVRNHKILPDDKFLSISRDVLIQLMRENLGEGVSAKNKIQSFNCLPEGVERELTCENKTTRILLLHELPSDTSLEEYYLFVEAK